LVCQRSCRTHGFLASTARAQIGRRFAARDATSDRFDWIADHEPLYTPIMGSTYGHVQEHLAQFYLVKEWSLADPDLIALRSNQP
jgi:hypothetical protein